MQIGQMANQLSFLLFINFLRSKYLCKPNNNLIREFNKNCETF